MPEDKKIPVAGSFAKLMSGAPRQETGESKASKKPIKQVVKKESNITSNITLLHFFTDTDVKDLKEPAYMAQTYRLREADIDWVKDTAHELSKQFKRRKVSQTDIVRISFKLFEKLLASNKAALEALFEKIK